MNWTILFWSAVIGVSVASGLFFWVLGLSSQKRENAEMRAAVERGEKEKAR